VLTTGNGEIFLSTRVSEETLTTIEESLGYQPNKPVASSRGRLWAGITIDIHSAVPDLELDAPALDHHLVAYCPSGSGRLEQSRDGKTHESLVRAGSVIVVPAGYRCSWRGTAPPSIRMRVPREMVDRAAEETGIPVRRHAELTNVFHTRDPLISQLGQLFALELERLEHPAQALLVESASTILAAHLLRKYYAFDQNETWLRGLPPRPLAEVIAYIEESSEDAISLDTLAGIANVSRFHFVRLFKKSTGLTPMAYVEESRIRKARSLIEQRKQSLAEIALVCGFADQSHFSRRFRRHVGFTPGEYSRTILGNGIDRGTMLEMEK
jgi:AraC family transcriptional regulator